MRLRGQGYEEQVAKIEACLAPILEPGTIVIQMIKMHLELLRLNPI